jgi:RNA polymerase subunit RPABC4/transcription elongation factor Spt4
MKCTTVFRKLDPFSYYSFPLIDYCLLQSACPNFKVNINDVPWKMKVLIIDPQKSTLCKKVQKEQYVFAIILNAAQITPTATE